MTDSGALVIVPTHDHARLLALVLAQLTRQTVDDLEIAVIGDGVGDDTRDVVSDARRNDPRIVFHDLPKAGRTGEPHRHAVLSETTRPVVTYVCDDDLLLADHVAEVTAALRHADLAVPRPTLIDAQGALQVESVELADDEWRRLIAGTRSYVSLSGLSHTLEAYRRLPHGWRVTPPGFHTDQWMYQQFLAQPWCRAVTTSSATALRFPSVMRGGMTDDEREVELARWMERLSTSDGVREFGVDVARASWSDAMRWRAWSFTHAAELDAARVNAIDAHRALGEVRAQLDATVADARRVEQELAVAVEESSDRLAELAVLREHYEAMGVEAAMARAKRDELAEELAAVRSTRTMRLRRRLLELRPVEMLRARRRGAR